MYISKSKVVISLVAIVSLLAALFLFTRPDPNADNEIETDLVINQCYRTDSCESAKLLAITMIEQRADERLVKATLQRGSVVDPDNDNFSVKWDNKKYTMFALCSNYRPRIAFENEDGYIAEEFDLANVPGAAVNSSNLYLGICHGTSQDQVRKNPIHYGYQASPDGGRGQFTISKPVDLFN